MRSKPLVFAGALLVLLGVGGLICPEIKMPAKKDEVQIMGQKVILQTRRIITIPAFLSIVVILAGAAVIFDGVRKG